MARRRRGSGLLGLIAIVVLALLLVYYFQRHDIHLPSFNTPTTTTPHKGGLAPLPSYPVRQLGIGSFGSVVREDHQDERDRRR